MANCCPARFRHTATQKFRLPGSVGNVAAGRGRRVFNPIKFFHPAPPEIPRWRKLKDRDTAGVEFFLRRMEPWCVSACGRFLDPRGRKDQAWAFEDREGISALILFSRQTLLPVFNGQPGLPLLRLFRRHFRTAHIHAIQGLREEVAELEEVLACLGKDPADIIDYDLMALDRKPPAAGSHRGPPGLTLRRPGLEDMDALFELQAGYEQEEIVHQGAAFHPAACRLNLHHIIEEGSILAAELKGRLVGKINTSIRSFTRCQIGGVYVHPDYRGLGIAHRMTAEFLRPLTAGGWGVTLFVKKKNPIARSVYQNLGFRAIRDYRITYY
jgi:ribosomal protein S18 acetylase RimI-like enzyme